MSESEAKESPSGKNGEDSSDPDEPKLKIWENEWMLRPCRMYQSEYRVCNSFRGKFNQIFVEGEVADCSQWKLDYENCTKWTKYDDEAAYEELLASEKLRRFARLKPHYANDVWKRRESPPDDWNAPLPDWLEKRDSATFLAAKQSQINTTGDRELELYIPSCTIL